jgi:zinc protease
MRLAASLLVSIAALGAPGAPRADPYERTLANGLRVIVKEDRRAPTVAHLVWYRAGAMTVVVGAGN